MLISHTVFYKIGVQVEKLLEVQPTLAELGESLTGIIDRVEEAGTETVSIINRNRELQTQIANLSGCRRVLTETIAILDLVQQVDMLLRFVSHRNYLSFVACSSLLPF